ncbi:hypothetical protein V5O39_29985 [Pseudomonas parakoreensis]
MLHAENQDRLYLITPSDEQQSLVGSLAFNVQDRHWLVYCALGGHQHADLPETDLLTGVSVLDFYSRPPDPHRPLQELPQAAIF